ncbi:PTS mannitol transporter subunit IICBA [Sinomonas cyclohexanicum]|uniref:Mannitol-specific phosphotransferase enzyme IIA component n=1 Tax=Sinomonas cyclohexanicum TaxID=322009 RepID=A0ABN6FKM0_SINCY|nr:PTS mannitol transporter subunit IICBA [Corynebacterium cyclohexanicum]BCT77354.1 PTS mannitol transporter subunit IICBA [Corynebacterium cyclohexanicum]
MSTTAAPSRMHTARAGVQKFGTFLSGMIMPNIGAFIAWGLITALFIEKGWLPVGALGGFGNGPDGKPYVGLVGPMITYLLPLLIAYTGGKAVYDVRGGVVGAIGTMGVILGAGIPMFIGAMIMGPLGGWTMKKIDAIWDGKIKPGFEMLVNNFSAGIWGAILALFGFYAISPVVTWFTEQAGNVVQFLVNNGLLPLTSIFIEPAKVLFLNNAINHGVLTPLGTQQSLEQGKSILFLLEANPGPGLGILLAYMFFGRGAAKASAPGAALIHFIGGIHEIYFPYVLMRPILILATMAGGMTGIATLAVTHSGLVAPAAPGSIIAVLAQTAKDSYFGVILSVILACAVSFVIASIILRASKDRGEGDLAAATAQMEGMKGKKSMASSVLGAGAAGGAGVALATDIKNIVFACDAGMGSSAMGASVLRNKIKAAGHKDVTVVNKAISALTDTYDMVVVHQDLALRAEEKTPSAQIVTVDNFMGSPKYDEIVALLDEQAATEPTPFEGVPAKAEPASEVEAAASHVPVPHVHEETKDVLRRESILLGTTAPDMGGAIDEAGRLLKEAGAVDDAYIASMHERETSVSTYMGNFLAIPHGTNEAKDHIQASAVTFIRYDAPVDWNGKPVKFVVGIAGKGKEHLGILAKIAKVFGDKEQVARLESAATVDEVLDILGKVNA